MADFYKVCRSTAHTLGLCVLSLGLVAMFSANAYAHRMKVFAWVDGQTIEGEAYFMGGEVIAGAKIELLAGQQVVATIQSDEVGQFRLESVVPQNYQVRADAGQGHVASFDIAVTEFVVEAPVAVADVQISAGGAASAVVAAQPVSSGLTAAQLEKAIAKAIRPLREEIDQYEAKVRAHDILGGIGYIFGLFGLWTLIRARKQ